MKCPQPAKPIAERIKARAFRTHADAMCSDGLRRERWVGVLQLTTDRKRDRIFSGQFRLREPFDTKAEAVAHAAGERQACITQGRMPETMAQRQRREDDEEETNA